MRLERNRLLTTVIVVGCSRPVRRRAIVGRSGHAPGLRRRDSRRMPDHDAPRSRGGRQIQGGPSASHPRPQRSAEDRSREHAHAQHHGRPHHRRGRPDHRRCGGRQQQRRHDHHQGGWRGAPRRRRHDGRADLGGPARRIVFRWQRGQHHHQVQLRVPERHHDPERLQDHRQCPVYGRARSRSPPPRAGSTSRAWWNRSARSAAPVGRQRPGGGPITISASCDLTIKRHGSREQSRKGPRRRSDPSGGRRKRVRVRPGGVDGARPRGPRPAGELLRRAEAPRQARQRDGVCRGVGGQGLVIDGSVGNNGEINADTAQDGGHKIAWIDLFAQRQHRHQR